MNDPANRDGAADAFGEALARFHDHLVGRGAGETPPVVDPATDATLDERLRADQQCLALIERVRRRYGDSLAALVRGSRPGDTPIDEAGPAGKTIGRFQIIREVARGGHGVVLLAHDPVLGRDVALKVPRAEALFDSELRARFLREAQAAGRLTHPNIVPVYEVDQAGPICYIASAYFHGPTLHDWLSERSELVPLRMAARLVADLASAVAFAHSQGVLHRDLKPSNVLLDVPSQGGSLSALGRATADRPDDLPLVPKLTDFGLAKLSESSDRFTRTGVVMGTPAYMAPEQAGSRPAEVGPATDVYALGAMLHEILVGRPPFAGTSDADTLRQVVSDDPLPLRRLRAEVPRDLEAIVLKCLEKRADRRYPTATALADDLHRFLAGEPTLARPLGPLARSVTWGRRHPVTATVCGAIVIAVASSFAGGLWHLSRLSAALDATRQAQSESQRREFALRQHIYLGDLKLAHQAWQRADVQQAVELLSHHTPKPGEKDIRGFFWRHLWWLSHGEPRTLSGHAGNVYHVEFSPDGKTLASGGADRSVRLWDVESGRSMVTLNGHRSDVNCLAFSPDGAMLASSDDSGEVRLWNTAMASLAFVLPGGQCRVANVTFTPDGQTLATAGSEPTIRLWDIATRTVRGTLKGHTGKITGVTVSSDGKLLASASTDETARVWDLATGKAVTILRGHQQYVKSIALSLDGKLATTAGIDETVRLWQIPSGLELAVLRGHRRRVSSAVFSRDDKLLASAGEDQTIHVWDVESRTAIRAYQTAQGRIWCVACSPRANLCATAGADGTVKLFDLAPGRQYVYPQWLPRTRDYGVYCLNGRCAGIANGANECIHADINWQRWQTITRVQPKDLAAMAVTRDGTTLAVGHTAGDIDFWDVRARKLLRSLRGCTTTFRCLTFNHRGTLMATCGETPDTAIRLWDVAAAQLIATLDAGEADTSCLEFSPDDRSLASGSRDSLVRLWDLQRQGLPVELRGHNAWVRAVAYSPDGRLLASGSDDSTVRLWDVQTQRDLGLVLHHPDHVGSVIFCPDDPLVISGCDDGVVRLWSVTSGEMLAEFRGHDRAITHLAFDPAARWLASSGSELFLWRADRNK